jgi:hypothetical protein
VSLTAGREALAAFEWEQATPRSLIAGDSPARWPAAGHGIGLRADLVAAHPWSWPGVGAGAVRVATARRQWALGVALAQLGGPAYRESRIGVGFNRAVDDQRLGLVASLLNVTAGDPVVGSRSGLELDLGWEVELSRLALAARATGVLQSRGTQALGAPRRLGLRVRCAARRLISELEIEEGSRGRRLRLGILLLPLEPLSVGAAWSSTEPPIRLLVGVRRGSLVLSGGWSWHSSLPPSQLIALSVAPRPRGTPPGAT